jgi:hypothetical protein
MDVVPLPLFQALGHDRRQEPSHRAVVEDLGRLALLQLQVHLDAMPLVGPDEFPGDVEYEDRCLSLVSTHSTNSLKVMGKP